MLKYAESSEMSAKLEIKKIIEIFNNKSKKKIEDNEEKYAVNSALLYTAVSNSRPGLHRYTPPT